MPLQGILNLCLALVSTSAIGTIGLVPIGLLLDAEAEMEWRAEWQPSRAAAEVSRSRMHTLTLVIRLALFAAAVLIFPANGQ